MIEIGEHDSAIKAFFKNGGVNKVLSNCLPSDNARNLVSHLLSMNWSASQPVQSKNIAKVLDTNEATISERIKPDINAGLKSFSDKYNITPSIQLYSRTRRTNVRKNINSDGYSNIGMHFACTYTSDKDVSGTFIPLDELKAILVETKKRIQLEYISIPLSKESLQLHIPLIAINPTKNQNLFRYEYRWLPFVGRDKEMSRLCKFVNYEGENLLWWAVTGKGGTGKNRLALELCLELEKEGWDAGFLTDTGQLDSLNGWQPAKPTLIVVDYVFQKARVLGEHFARIYTNAMNWKYPVRFLFLERYEESEALTEFCYPNREIIENNCRFNNIALLNESPSLKLEGIGEGFSEQIISEIFAKYRKVPSAEQLSLIRNITTNLESGRRPLYIMFAADACARNENIRDWDIDRLHQSVLDHNKKTWKETGIDETDRIDYKHINLLSFATIVNSVQVEFLDNLQDMETDKGCGPEFTRLFPDRYEFDLAKYQIISDSNAIEELPGIVPDVIGEHFILQKWKTSPAEVSSFFKLGWQYKPQKVSRFVTYMAMDFPYENTVEKIIETVLAEKGSDVNKIVLLYNLLIIHGDLKNYNALERHLKRLVGIWHYCDPGDTAVYFHFVHALEYIVSIYARTGNMIKAEEHYEYLKAVIDSKIPNTPDISLSMAKATKDILLANAKLNRVSDAEICFKSIESIYGQHHPNNRDIGIQLALGMGSMVYLHSQLKQPDTARKYYGKLQSLWENYPAHSELSWIVSSSMLHLSIAYGSIERYPEAMRYVDKLYELCTRQKYPADILQNYAFSILHLLYCFIEASEKKWALKYYNTFKELCEQHPGNKELMLMLSDAKKKYDTLHV